MLITKVVGRLAPADAQHLEQSLREWLGLWWHVLTTGWQTAGSGSVSPRLTGNRPPSPFQQGTLALLETHRQGGPTPTPDLLPRPSSALARHTYLAQTLRRGALFVAGRGLCYQRNLLSCRAAHGREVAEGWDEDPRRTTRIFLPAGAFISILHIFPGRDESRLVLRGLAGFQHFPHGSSSVAVALRSPVGAHPGHSR